MTILEPQTHERRTVEVLGWRNVQTMHHVWICLLYIYGHVYCIQNIHVNAHIYTYNIYYMYKFANPEPHKTQPKANLLDGLPGSLQASAAAHCLNCALYYTIILYCIALYMLLEYYKVNYKILYYIILCYTIVYENKKYKIIS